METAFVFPYFLARLLGRAGIAEAPAEWLGLLLSSAGFVAVLFAPFHPRLRFKVGLVAVGWMVVLLAATGCIWDCEDARQNCRPERERRITTGKMMVADIESRRSRASANSISATTPRPG